MTILFWAVSTIMVLAACSQEERRFCGNSQPRDISEIKKLAVFNQTQEIKIVSYKREDGNLSDRLNGGATFDANMVYEMETLDEEDRDDLLGILANYDLRQASRFNSIEATIAFCYDPRNAILFFNGNNEVVGYVELCFECSQYKAYPAALNVGLFCDEKFEVLKAFFQNNGVAYGTDVSQQELLDERRAYLKKEWNKTSRHHVLDWLSVAKLEMDAENFNQAIKYLNTALRLDSTNRHAYVMRGRSYFEMGEYENARQDFTRVLKLYPNTREAYRDRARSTIEIYKRTGDGNLLLEVCSDLQTAHTFDDGVISELQGRYCGK